MSDPTPASGVIPALPHLLHIEAFPCGARSVSRQAAQTFAGASQARRLEGAQAAQSAAA